VPWPVALSSLHSCCCLPVVPQRFYC
jgi:hypothetical protein